MTGPPPAVAATRVAVRGWLRQQLAGGGLPARRQATSGGPPTHGLVLVACSGGADSLALLAATAFVAPELGLRAGAVVIDHGLQPGSGRVVEEAAALCRRLLADQGRDGRRPSRESQAPGAPQVSDDVTVVRVQVGATAAGPEADARAARHTALEQAADRLGAAAVLLGHTRDDQAEQVLLGLVRGSGARSLSGMPSTRPLSPVAGASGPPLPRRPLLGRPLLGVSRAQTRQVCADLGLEPWDDPHNEDPRYARVRARRALAHLSDDLGPGLVAGLARSAGLLRDDGEALEERSDAAYRDLGQPPWPVGRLTTLPRAVRTRLWRRAALAAGSPGTDLTSEHLLAVDALVTDWSGQGPLHLPGGVRARRRGEEVGLTGPT